MYFCRNKGGGSKVDLKLQLPWIIVGRFGKKSPLVYSRWSTIEVDLNDLNRSTNKILDVLGCDAELRLHITNTKFPCALFSRFPSVGVPNANTKRCFTT